MTTPRLFRFAPFAVRVGGRRWRHVSHASAGAAGADDVAEMNRFHPCFGAIIVMRVKTRVSSLQRGKWEPPRGPKNSSTAPRLRRSPCLPLLGRTVLARVGLTLARSCASSAVTPTSTSRASICWATALDVAWRTVGIVGTKMDDSHIHRTYLVD